MDLVQVAPGVYEAPLGEVDPGAYAVRVTQTKPGTSPLGRTLGLVAPTAAEYRLLGANEPFLAALRSATGGGEIADRRGPVDPRPDRHQPLHGPVAAAARPGAAAVAARHRPPARLDRPSRAGVGPRLGHEPRRAARTARPADRHERGPARGPRPDRECRTIGDARGRDTGRHGRAGGDHGRPAGHDGAAACPRRRPPPHRPSRRHRPPPSRPHRPLQRRRTRRTPTRWPASAKPSAAPASADRRASFAASRARGTSTRSVIASGP